MPVSKSSGAGEDEMTIFRFIEHLRWTEWLCSWNGASGFDSFFNQVDPRQNTCQYFGKKLCWMHLILLGKRTKCRWQGRGEIQAWYHLLSLREVPFVLIYFTNLKKNAAYQFISQETIIHHIKNKPTKHPPPTTGSSSQIQRFMKEEQAGWDL